MSEVTYRDAGVDIDLEGEAVRALLAGLTHKRTGRFPMCGGPGHYAGLIDLGPFLLGMTVDGVGTKMLVADRLGDWTTVGIDCVAMNVNDLYVMNIEPIAFVDYIATDRLDLAKMTQIGFGLNEGARLADISIVGGETATLKGLVTGLDLAGTAVGVQDREKVVTGEKIRPGDFIVGVPSSGVHSNGLTLARQVVAMYNAWDERLPGGGTVAQELLKPTRIYASALSVAAVVPVHGMCHVTGGGLQNFRRLSRYGFSFSHPLPPQSVFQWVQESGGVSEAEMYRTFNMGMGYAFIVPQEAVGGVTSIVKDARVVGEVTEAPGLWLKGTEL